MKTKVIYFVHGTTFDNAEGKCSGWRQAQLTEIGKKRAIELGKIRKNTYFDIIFTSDLERAIESAKLAFPNIKHIQDKRLRECNYGELEGKDKKVVVYEEHIEEPFPNGESLKTVTEYLRLGDISAKESYNINKAIQTKVVKEDTSYADYFAKTCGFKNKKELLKYTKAVFELADKEQGS